MVDSYNFQCRNSTTGPNQGAFNAHHWLSSAEDTAKFQKASVANSWRRQRERHHHKLRADRHLLRQEHPLLILLSLIHHPVTQHKTRVTSLFFLNRTGSYDDQQHLTSQPHCPNKCVEVLLLYNFRFKSFPIKVVHRRAPSQQNFYMGKSYFLTFKCILINHDPKLNTEKDSFLLMGRGGCHCPWACKKIQAADVFCTWKDRKVHS